MRRVSRCLRWSAHLGAIIAATVLPACVESPSVPAIPAAEAQRQGEAFLDAVLKGTEDQHKVAIDARCVLAAAFPNSVNAEKLRSIGIHASSIEEFVDFATYENDRSIAMFCDGRLVWKTHVTAKLRLGSGMATFRKGDLVRIYRSDIEILILNP